MLRRNWSDLDEHGQKGDWIFMEDDSMIVLRWGPGTDDVCALRLAGRWKKDNGPAWDWNGDKNKPTLSPSIRVYGMTSEKVRETAWHGWLRDGALVEDGS